MKRLTPAFAALVILGACTPAVQRTEENAEDLRTRIELCNDPDTLTIYIERAVAFAQTIADCGRITEAQMYLNDIQDAVARKRSDVVTYYRRAVATVDSLPPAPVDSALAAPVDSIPAVPAAPTDSVALTV